MSLPPIRTVSPQRISLFARNWRDMLAMGPTDVVEGTGGGARLDEERVPALQ